MVKIGEINNIPGYPIASSRLIRLDVFLRKKGISVKGDSRLILGLLVKEEIINKLFNGQIKTLQIDPGITFLELENLFKNFLELSKRTSCQGEILRICRKLTPLELVSRFKEEILTSPLLALRLLLEEKESFPKDEIVSLLNQHLQPVVHLFQEEKVNEREFKELLDLFNEIGNHEINRRFVETLIKSDKCDPSWPAWALSFFRERYPQEIWYHETDGDFAMKFGVYDWAKGAYEQALALDPKNMGLSKKLKQAKRLLEKEKDEENVNFRKKVLALWREINKGNETAAEEFLNLIKLRTKEFGLMLDSSLELLRSSQVLYSNLKILEEVALKKGEENLASFLDHKIKDFIFGLFNRLVKGNVLKPEEHRLIASLLESGEVEGFSQEFIKKIAQAAEDCRRKENKATCIFVMWYLFGRHFNEGLDLFQKGQHEEALAKFMTAYQNYQGDLDCRRNIAILLSGKGIEYLYSENLRAAEESFKKALEFDPECLVALEKLMLVHLSNNEPQKAIEFGKRILKVACPQEFNHAQVWERTQIANYGNIGLAYLKLFGKDGNIAHLKKAEEFLSRALESEPANFNYQYNWAILKILKGEAEEIKDWVVKKLANPEVSISYLLDFTLAFWQRTEFFKSEIDASERGFLEEMLEVITRNLLERVKGDGNLKSAYASVLVDHGINLLAHGFKEIGEIVIYHFLGEEYRGSDAYYYALYALANLDLESGKRDFAWQRLKEIIDSDTKLKIFDYHFADFLSIKIHAFSLMIDSLQENRQGIDSLFMELVQRMRDEFPQNPAMLNAVGAFFEKTGKRFEALNYYQKAVACDPLYLFPYFNILRIATLTKNGEEIEKYLRKLKSSVEQIIKQSKENEKEISRFRLASFYEAMIEFYLDEKNDEVIRILELIIRSEAERDALEGIAIAIEKFSAVGKQIPNALLQLVKNH